MMPMTMRRAVRVSVHVAAALTAVASAGCLDYTIETTLEPDGSGTRAELMEIEENDDFTLSEAEFLTLAFAGPEHGWRPEVVVDAGGDTTARRLHRRTEIGTLSGWTRSDRSIRIAGALPAMADTRIGYVRLGDVEFRNELRVGAGRRSDGTRSTTYRERFYWSNGPDAAIELVLEGLDRRLTDAYPDLTETDRASITGFARARMWLAHEEGLLADPNDERTRAMIVPSTTLHALKIVRTRYPQATAEAVRDVATAPLVGEDEESSREFSELLPGLELAFNTNLVVRVTMPGRVTATNAERRDGNVLEWEFSPLDAFTPIELFAESLSR